MATDPVTSATIAGAIVAVIVASAPRIIDRVLGRRRDDADATESVGAAAGSVTAAAIALLDQMRADRDQCRAELAALNERIDALHPHSDT